MRTFVVTRQVEYVDTDMAGIVHFTAYFRYVEAAEHAFLRSCGISLCDPPGARSLCWPRVACSFSYREPLRFDDTFEVRLRVGRIGRSSVTFSADIVRGGRVLAQGSSTNACCRLASGGTLRAVAIPKAVRAKLSA